MKDRGHVGIFLARHGIRFCQGAGSWSRFSSASGSRPQCVSRCEAASSALACTESHPRKAVRNASVHRAQATALASAEPLNGKRHAGLRSRVSQGCLGCAPLHFTIALHQFFATGSFDIKNRHAGDLLLLRATVKRLLSRRISRTHRQLVAAHHSEFGPTRSSGAVSACIGRLRASGLVMLATRYSESDPTETSLFDGNQLPKPPTTCAGRGCIMMLRASVKMAISMVLAERPAAIIASSGGQLTKAE
jgi:hypothetical protein